MRLIFKTFLVLILMSYISISHGFAKQSVSIIFTTNLEGDFLVNENGPAQQDPMLNIAEMILSAKKTKPIDLYLDLGNAFYPGLLSKFSYGSLVMDFLDILGCNATLISSKDLHIGIDSLESISQKKSTALLSANISIGANLVFKPYTIYSHGDTRIAILGISSSQIRFDIAEKNIYNIELKNESEAISLQLKDIKAKGIRHVILLSGLELEDTLELLKTHQQIDMAVCGGDSSGKLYNSQATRIDMLDGRSVLMLQEKNACYFLDVSVDNRISIEHLEKRIITDATSVRRPVNTAYENFCTRLAHWRKRFNKEETVILTNPDTEYPIDNDRFCFLLRDTYNAEIAIVNKDTLTASIFKGKIQQSDILNTIHNDYPIFVFNLSGDDLKQVYSKQTDMIVNGFKDGLIQGYPVENKRQYRVVCPQASFDTIGYILGKPISYQNTWKNVTDHVMADIKGKQILFKNNFSYLDKRFRTTVDVFLANYYNTSSVNRTDNIAPPAGKPTNTYKQWGMENRIFFCLYNKMHRLTLSPYILYAKQSDTYLQNQLKGTLIYNWNLRPSFQPYHKSQIDTVIQEEAGIERPISIRETFGIDATIKRLKIKIGTGFEKKVQGPSEEGIYGFEGVSSFDYELWKDIKYSFDLDMFSSPFKSDGGYLYSEVINAVTFPFSQYMGFSLKHKWFYYDSTINKKDYSNIQFLASIDLRTDLKLW